MSTRSTPAPSRHEPELDHDHAPDVRRDTSIQDFLDRLGRAVTSGDGAAAARLWETPALVIGDDMQRAVSTEAELVEFFGGAKAQYNARGITDTRAEIVRLTWPTERIAIVEVRWPYLDAKGDEVGDETSTYTLRRDDAGTLRLRVAVMHGASKPSSAPYLGPQA
jgi:hypothetical protein